MQAVPQSFHNKSQAGIRKNIWSTLVSFKKKFNSTREFFILDSSEPDGPDVIAPVGDSSIQFWDYYHYDDYKDKVTGMEWSRAVDFPYSTQSSSASVTFNNIDQYFTPNGEPIPTAPIITNQSTNPSFESASGSVEVRRNLVTNPRMAGSGEVAQSFYAYQNTTSVTGTRVVSNNTQTINITAISGGARNYGVSYGLYPIVGHLAIGDSITFSIDVSAISAPSTVSGQILVEQSNGSVWPNNSYSFKTTGRKSITYTNTTLSSSNSISVFVFLTSTSDWSGTASMSFSNLLAEKTKAQLPYFDGSTNTIDTASLSPSWTGAVNNSQSVLTGIAPAGAYTTNSASLKIWQSKDTPNHGSRIARGLVVNPSQDIAFVARDTSGVSSGQEVTSIANVRVSRGTSANPRWRTVAGGDFSSAGDTVTLTAGQWSELRYTGSPATANANFGIIIPAGSLQAGDTIDFDNHMVVKGDYTGPYRDGDSPSWNWSEGQSSSISNGQDLSAIVDDSNTSIRTYMVEGRPIKLLAGYQGEPLLQQFVGLTDSRPEIDKGAGTAKFTATDYLSEIFKLELTGSIAMANARTDQVLEALLRQFGIESYQYHLDEGVNVIPFVFLNSGASAAECIREIMQAEGGQLWIDEQGIIQFNNRNNVDNSVVYKLDKSNIVSMSASGDSDIINRVHIKTSIRSVRQLQTIHAGSGELNNPTLSDPITIGAGQSISYTATIEDPILSFNAPVNGYQSGDSWFTATNTSGTVITSGITASSTSMTVNSITVTLTNSNTYAVLLTQIQLYGMPARVLDVLEYDAQDGESIATYGERLLEIKSDMFGSEENCDSFARSVLTSYAGYNNVVEMSIKSNYALQLNDIIEVDTDEVSGIFQITKMVWSIGNNGITQKITIKRYGNNNN